MGMKLVRPWSGIFEAYSRTHHASSLPGVPELCDRLKDLAEAEDTVTWCILASEPRTFTAFFNTTDIRLVVLPGFTGGVEYHPIRVLRQFGFCQDSFGQSNCPARYKEYVVGSNAITTELARRMREGVRSTSLALTAGSDCTAEYEAEIQESWPLNEIPPSGTNFAGASSSKRPRRD